LFSSPQAHGQIHANGQKECKMSLFSKRRSHGTSPATPKRSEGLISSSLIGGLKKAVLLPLDLFASYLHTLKELLSFFSPRFHKRNFRRKQRQYMVQYRLAFSDRPTPDFAIKSKLIRYTTLVVKVEYRALLISSIIFIIIFPPIVTAFLFSVPIFLETYIISDSYLVSKTTSSSVVLLFLLGSIINCFLCDGEARKAMFFAH
jgi:hypothetical protein